MGDQSGSYSTSSLFRQEDSILDAREDVFRTPIIFQRSPLEVEPDGSCLPIHLSRLGLSSKNGL